jgi:hypothetical protein
VNVGIDQAGQNCSLAEIVNFLKPRVDPIWRNHCLNPLAFYNDRGGADSIRRDDALGHESLHAEISASRQIWTMSLNQNFILRISVSQHILASQQNGYESMSTDFLGK